MAKKRRKKAKVVSMKPKMSLGKYIKLKGRSLPIHEVLMSANIMDVGKGHVFVTREKKSGAKIIGFFMVDLYCLGLKDTFFREYSQYEYEEFIDEMSHVEGGEMEVVNPNHAFNMIYGAVEYAEDLGLDPHKDFDITEQMLAPVESIEYEDIEFGRNGRPCYFYYHGDRKADILKKLTTAVGPDGFDYVDGESHFDAFDAFEDFEDDDFIGLSNEYYSSDLDKDSYLSYIGLFQHIFNLFLFDSESLAELYERDQNQLLDTVLDGFKDVIVLNEEGRKYIEDLRTNRTLVLAIA